MMGIGRCLEELAWDSPRSQAGWLGMGHQTFQVAITPAGVVLKIGKQRWFRVIGL